MHKLVIRKACDKYSQVAAETMAAVCAACMKPAQQKFLCVSLFILCRSDLYYLYKSLYDPLCHLPGGGCEALKPALMKGGGGP